MRGKVAVSSYTTTGCRITPAYAGKRTHQRCIHMVTQDHPRVCGEKSSKSLIRNAGEGSPPRMRGKVVNTRYVFIIVGDHPRVCGEKWPVTTLAMRMVGSPPRMRGKADYLFLLSEYEGDHPRVCGEKDSALRERKEQWGSPPRMRGKEIDNNDSVETSRITPAYAGKRSRRSYPLHKFRDHPRVCGEKVLFTVAGHDSIGSPPRMRGKVCLLCLLPKRIGITPAYAGKRICWI